MQLGTGTGLLILASSLLCSAQLCPPNTPCNGTSFPALINVTLDDLQNGFAQNLFTSVDLVNAYIDRINEANGTLSMVTELNPDAVSIAQGLDQERAQGKVRGPLHGIPVLIKNNIATDDAMNNTAGSFALIGAKVPRDSTIAAKLRQAGAIILGKSNLSQWANFRSNVSDNGWSAYGGQTKGAYYPNQDPSGSSSGSGVSASIGLAWAAIGTETDGSILSPSEVNSLAGIKPSVGLTSRYLVIPISATQDTVGPMARTVKDAASLLSAIAGPDPNDNYTSAIPNNGAVPDYVGACNNESLAGAKFGVPRNVIAAFSDASSGPVLTAFEDYLNVLRGAGANVIDSNFTLLDEYLQSNNETIVLDTEFINGLANYLAELTFNPLGLTDLEGIRNFTQTFPAEQYPFRDTGVWDSALALGYNASDLRHYQAVLADQYLSDGLVIGAIKNQSLDAVLLPTQFSPPFAAIAQSPVVTVPMGYYPANTTVQMNQRGDLVAVSPNYPFGFSFLGDRFTEASLIGYGHALEQRTLTRNTVQPFFIPNTELWEVAHSLGRHLSMNHAGKPRHLGGTPDLAARLQELRLISLKYFLPSRTEHKVELLAQVTIPPSDLQMDYALPVAAATASLLYLDARAQLSYDIFTLKQFIRHIRHDKHLIKTDSHNTFFFIEQQCRASPSHLFLLYEDRKWTYQEAYEAVLRHARWLKEHCSIHKNTIVAMDFTNKPEFIWFWFALWSLGAKPALLNHNLTGRPLIHSLRMSTAKLVLVDDEIQDKLTDEVRKELGGQVEVTIVTQETERSIENLQPFREEDAARKGQQPSEMSMLIYTSGTTGLPKPAIVSWAKVNRAAMFSSGSLGLKPSDVFHTSMPLYHSAASLLCTVTTIAGGATVSLGHRFSPRTFWSEVRAHKATVIQYVGETLRYLLAVPPSPLDKDHQVRLAFGNGLRPDIWNKVKDRFGIDTILEFYAATEAPVGTWNKCRNDFSAGAVGRTGSLLQTLFKGQSEVIELDIVTEQPVRDPETGLCKRVEPNLPGELVAKLNEQDIEETFQGYFGNRGATDKKILRDVVKKGDAFFRTGDLIRRPGNGLTFFVDRIGDTFRWKSENVSTTEVAEVMGAHPAISEANVYGVLVPGHDGRAGCAAVLLEDSKQVNDALLASLAEHTRKNLAPYALPIFLRFTSTLETTGTQKTVKHALREEGVEPGRLKGRTPQDQLFWLRGDTYVPFRERDWEALNAGGVKL